MFVSGKLLIFLYFILKRVKCKNVVLIVIVTLKVDISSHYA